MSGRKVVDGRMLVGRGVGAIKDACIMFSVVNGGDGGGGVAAAGRRRSRAEVIGLNE